jgi:hypothetical protein
LSNIILLAFMFLHRPPGPPSGPRDIIVRRLHFDQSQTAAYDLLIREHRVNIQRMDSAIMVTKNQLYQTVALPVDREVVDSLESALGRLQMQVEDIHWNHFHDIQSLCREDQMDEFESLLKEISRLFTGPKERRDRR